MSGSSSHYIKIEQVLSGPSVVLNVGNCSNFLRVGMRWFFGNATKKNRIRAEVHIPSCV